MGYLGIYQLDKIDDIDYSKMSHVAVALVETDANGQFKNRYESWLPTDSMLLFK